MKKFISSYPILFGVLIAVFMMGALIVLNTWFPWTNDYSSHHKALDQGVYFTARFFAFWIYSLWRWHRRALFWASMFAILVLHSVGLFLYTTYFQRVLVWQWTFVGLVESCLVFGLVNQFMRSQHPDRNQQFTMSSPEGLLNNGVVLVLLSLYFIIYSLQSWASIDKTIYHRVDIFTFPFSILMTLVLVSVAYKSTFWADRLVLSAGAGVLSLGLVRSFPLTRATMLAINVANASMLTLGAIVCLIVLVRSFRPSIPREKLMDEPN